MNQPVVVALITAGGAVLAALVTILPHLLARRTKRPAADAATGPPRAPQAIPRGDSEQSGPPRSPPAIRPATGGQSVRVYGTSASPRRTPRELDLTMTGDDLLLHIHAPRDSRCKVWISRDLLQTAMDQWAQNGSGADRIEVQGRRATRASRVLLVFKGDGEVEVQSRYWIWVKQDELRAALEQLGLRIPW